jgi:3-oxoacyl-[acyl-carrier-protein] synthase III
VIRGELARPRLCRPALAGWGVNRFEVEAMLRYAAITGWGHCLPDRVVTNHDLAGRIDTSDEWIWTRTGIRERRIAGPGDTTSSLCTTAARRALTCANLPASQVDLVICASTTPDHLLPNTGSIVQQRIGATQAGAFDLNAACSGFVYALAVGSQFIRAGALNRVLVVAGETLSRFTNWDDRATCILFGDGAGAVVLEGTDMECGVLSTVLGSRGDTDHLLAIEAGGSARPATPETIARGEHLITMRGSDIFRLAVRSMSRAAEEALAQAGVEAPDVRAIIPHQANLRILRSTQEALGVPWEKFVVNVERCGNTGAASVPIVLSEFLNAGDVRPGENLLLATFGGGLTWASAVVRWGDVAAIVAQREVQRAPAHFTPPDKRHERAPTALAG